jgi:ribosomal protein L23
MSSCFLVQTEKAYNLQTNNVYVLAFFDKNVNLKSAQLKILLEKNSLKTLKINSVTSNQKTKRRGGAKRSTQVRQFRPKKFYIKLQAGQIIDEKIVEKINQNLKK